MMVLENPNPVNTQQTPELALPAAYRIPGSHSWLWVELEEIALALKMEPEELWERYFYLTRYLIRSTIIIFDRSSGIRHVKRNEIIENGHYGFFVPFGWVRDVRNAVEAGVYRVIRNPHIHEAKMFNCEEVSLRCQQPENRCDYFAAVPLDQDRNMLYLPELAQKIRERDQRDLARRSETQLV